MNRFASFWQPAGGAAKQIGDAIAAKTKRPVGIIWMQTKASGAKGEPKFDRTTVGYWMAPEHLKNAPSLMEDYKTVGSKFPDNPYYLANVRRYIADWKQYWGEYIPEMMTTKAVPEGAVWGASWGHYPSSAPQVGDSKATQVYNIYVHPFADTVVKGIIFLTNEAMVNDAEGANFGSEMSAQANCFKAKFGDEDTTLIYTVPNKALAPKITRPTKIKGPSTAVEIGDWSEVAGVIEQAAK